MVSYRSGRLRPRPPRDEKVLSGWNGLLISAFARAGTTLPDVDIAVEEGEVYLADEEYEFEHLGGIDEGDDGPSSTSHVGF